MIKLEMLDHTGKIKRLYQVVGIKDRRLYLVYLQGDKDRWEHNNPSFKIYYRHDVGNYIINPITQNELYVDKALKELINEFHFKGDENA